jgi:hypothetical protein
MEGGWRAVLHASDPGHAEDATQLISWPWSARRTQSPHADPAASRGQLSVSAPHVLDERIPGDDDHGALQTSPVLVGVVGQGQVVISTCQGGNLGLAAAWDSVTAESASAVVEVVDGQHTVVEIGLVTAQPSRRHQAR